jgi:transcription elongation GreA/GreB family factor
MSQTLKQKVFDFCRSYVTERLEAARSEMKALQDSANEETKSSAGDKYETARAMAQLEIEKLSGQVAEFTSQLSALSKIRVEVSLPAAAFGSLVETDRGFYFIAISIGEVKVDDQKMFVISPSSPMAQKLVGLKSGESCMFNKTSFKILNVN